MRHHRERPMTGRNFGRWVKRLPDVTKGLGSFNEHRALAVLVQVPEDDQLPAWFKEVITPTHDQDMRGIDLIVNTDVGHIYIQIKSSEAGRKRFESQAKRNRPIAVVVVKHDEDDRIVRHKVLQAVAGLRQKFLAKRSARQPLCE